MANTGTWLLGNQVGRTGILDMLLDSKVIPAVCGFFFRLEGSVPKLCGHGAFLLCRVCSGQGGPMTSGVVGFGVACRAVEVGNLVKQDNRWKQTSKHSRRS